MTECGAAYSLAEQVPLFAAPPTPVLTDAYTLPPRSTTLNAELLPGAEVRRRSARELRSDSTQKLYYARILPRG